MNTLSTFSQMATTKIGPQSFFKGSVNIHKERYAVRFFF